MMIWRANGHHLSPEMRPNRPTPRSEVQDCRRTRGGEDCKKLVITLHAILLVHFDGCQWPIEPGAGQSGERLRLRVGRGCTYLSPLPALRDEVAASPGRCYLNTVD